MRLMPVLRDYCVSRRFLSIRQNACSLAAGLILAKIILRQCHMLPVGGIANDRFPLVPPGTRPAAVGVAERIQFLLERLAAYPFIADVFGAGTGFVPPVCSASRHRCRRVSDLASIAKFCVTVVADIEMAAGFRRLGAAGNLQRDFLPWLVCVVDIFFEVDCACIALRHQK